jgi:spermidine/putrescine transport system permease protein
MRAAIAMKGAMNAATNASMSEGAWGWRAVKAASVLVYIFMFAPIAVTVLLSFNDSQFGGFPIKGFSLRWFGVLMQNDIVLSAFQLSLEIGAVTAVICTILGILAAMALVRYDFPGKEWVNALLIAPVLIPETVLAVGLLLFLHWLNQPRTFLLLLLGHVMMSLPYVVLVVQARLIGIKRVYEEAALSLGANRFQSFREITLPLLMPAILAGILLAFTISFDNVTATLFWRPPGKETLPTQIYSMLHTSISPEINALGTLMIVITVGLPLLGGALARSLARRQR